MIERYLGDRTRILIVGMDPLQAGHLPHPGHQAVGGHMQRIEVVAVEAELKRRDILVIELLKLDVGFGETVCPYIGILVQDSLGILDRGGIDDELGVILTCNLRGIAHLEAGRRTPDE